MTAIKDNELKIPKQMIWIILVICILPFVLNLFGVDFGSEKTVFNPADALEMPESEMVDAMFYRLSGAFSHTILEWSAFCAAIFTVLLSFIHFRIKGDIVTPLIGIALFFAGVMDAFHTLAADRLIEAVADNRNLIPFTWAICRLFKAIIPIVGVYVLIMRKKKETKGGIGFIIISSSVLFVIAYGIIHICATSDRLPQTMFPDSIITRPYDVAPLFFYLAAGAFVYRKFYHDFPSLFSHAMLISVIPDIATQSYMAFGSSALFDNNFNIAHFIKIIAYIVPLIGLCLDYVKTYHEEEKVVKQLTDEIATRKVTETALKESEAKTSAIVNTAVDGIITIDEHGIIATFNPAASLIFGYEPSEVIGRNVSILMPEPYHSEHDRYLTNYKQTGEKKIIGTGREVKGRRKDGAVFPLYLAISETHLADGRMFTGIVRDITEEKEAESALIQAKEDAEEASRIKSSFLNTISHELRTPLTVMLGNLPMLTEIEELPEPDEAVDIARDIESSGKHLLTLINDLLDLSKIEAGKMDLRMESCSITSIIEDAVSTVQVLANNKGLSLDTRIEELDLFVDPIRIKQVLLNLLSNAIKFTDRGGIWVKAAGSNGTVNIQVQDTGKGMDESEIGIIFDPFRQVDSSSTRAIAGTGLGLAITRKLVELHGGTISATSKKGEGSTFNFSIPVGKDRKEERNENTYCR